MGFDISEPTVPWTPKPDTDSWNTDVVRFLGTFAALYPTHQDQSVAAYSRYTRQVHRHQWPNRLFRQRGLYGLASDRHLKPMGKRIGKMSAQIKDLTKASGFQMFPCYHVGNKG